ncbi:MAG: hypothetical protein U9Q22_03350 [Candidatus Altiarchaeota archaeon]|nr:hypothetical protein [Candidatus Altiarchaeota archaeon]
MKMTEVVHVKLKGRLQNVVDILVKEGIYKNQEEVVRSGVRMIGEAYGLIPSSARYHLRELQLKSKRKSPEGVMEDLERVNSKVWKEREDAYL